MDAVKDMLKSSWQSYSELPARALMESWNHLNSFQQPALLEHLTGEFKWESHYALQCSQRKSKLSLSFFLSLFPLSLFLLIYFLSASLPCTQYLHKLSVRRCTRKTQSWEFSNSPEESLTIAWIFDSLLMVVHTQPLLSSFSHSDELVYSSS